VSTPRPRYRSSAIQAVSPGVTDRTGGESYRTETLALSLPANEYKATILTITYAVVLFSIIVQGLTTEPLVERIVSKGALHEPA